ncbi:MULTISPECIES: hypothetical protein [unclassified Novosphingobium]|uniref:hypothetical protein n=1 Tax=unclassified Novosphingobium TaxID=2644732 RepID=UPI000EC72B12|nr:MULTISPECIES: hypothetical protein [unclassified Novosphingobium]HCF25422.1 hypothetical protein [Novosphingobium sp.]HQV04178.1 hypothetical protein [Novosphingobium sp.]
MSDNRLTLFEAISRKRIVEALYNGATIRLAPHLIFERHGDLFVSALNLGKTWRSDEEPRLGQFKLAGLNETVLQEDSFEPLAGFKPETPRADDVLILAV